MSRTAIVVAVALLFFAADGQAKETLKVTSPDIKEGKPLTVEQVFNGFGCTGKNISPALKWTGVP